MAGKKLRCQEGFSLIEVLISLVILAIGLLGLALFQTTAIKGNAIASKWTVATELAQDRLEKFRHVGWDNVNLASSNTGGFTPGPPPQPNTQIFPGDAGRQHDRPRDAILQGLVRQPALPPPRTHSRPSRCGVAGRTSRRSGTT